MKQCWAELIPASVESTEAILDSSYSDWPNFENSSKLLEGADSRWYLLANDTELYWLKHVHPIQYFIENINTQATKAYMI